MPAMSNDFERATNKLIGVLSGIKADRKINIKELQKLKEWLETHNNLLYKMPFCEIYEMIERIVEDEIIDEYEQDDLMQYCKNYEEENSPYDNLKNEIQVLHGFVLGIGADNIINTDEVKALEKWMLYHEPVITKWPFDKLYNHLQKILEDGVVTKEEEIKLLNFITGFQDNKTNFKVYDKTVFVNRWMETDAPIVETMKGITEKVVNITIEGKSVCITGLMKVKRGTVIDLIIERGGISQKNVTLDLNYLVIGDLSNPCWKYTTYGGKIEKAMEYKKEGAKISIVSENDFLVALNS